MLRRKVSEWTLRRKYSRETLATALGMPGETVEFDASVLVARDESGGRGEVYRLTEDGGGRVAVWHSSLTGRLKDGDRVRIVGHVVELIEGGGKGLVTALARCRVVNVYEAAGGD